MTPKNLLSLPLITLMCSCGKPIQPSEGEPQDPRHSAREEQPLYPQEWVERPFFTKGRLVVEQNAHETAQEKFRKIDLSGFLEASVGIEPAEEIDMTDVDDFLRSAIGLLVPYSFTGSIGRPEHEMEELVNLLNCESDGVKFVSTGEVGAFQSFGSFDTVCSPNGLQETNAILREDLLYSRRVAAGHRSFQTPQCDFAQLSGKKFRTYDHENVSACLSKQRSYQIKIADKIGRRSILNSQSNRIYIGEHHNFRYVGTEDGRPCTVNREPDQTFSVSNCVVSMINHKEVEHMDLDQRFTETSVNTLRIKRFVGSVVANDFYIYTDTGSFDIDLSGWKGTLELEETGESSLKGTLSKNTGEKLIIDGPGFLGRRTNWN